MELLSGYSDAGINAFNAQQNANWAFTNNNINNQMAAQNQMMAAANAQSAAMAQPTPYGYGFVGGYPTFGDPAAPGTYSPGSGLSSFSGVPLSGGYPAGQVEYGGPMPAIPYQNPFGGGGYGAEQMSPWERSQMQLSMNPGATANVPSSGSIGSMDWLGGYNPYGQTYQPPAYTPPPAQSFNDMWNGRGAASLYQNNEWFNQPVWQNQMNQQQAGQYDFLDRWGTMQAPAPGFGLMNSDGGSLGSNFLGAGGGFSNAGADPWGGYRDPGNIDRYRSGEAYGQPSANPSYFDPGTYYGPGSGGGYDPWRSAALPAYDPNSFANRFAAGGYYNPGTPSQYTTETYRDVGGIAYPGGMAPTGYQGLYGMEDPTGALPLGWSPVDNQGQKHFFGG
jgi:hypothetical protein